VSSRSQASHGFALPSAIPHVALCTDHVQYLQASHGFAQSSKWAPSIGAFINLESTGNGGPDVLFQHTGHWTVATYARSALTPRGSVIGQVGTQFDCTC